MKFSIPSNSSAAKSTNSFSPYTLDLSEITLSSIAPAAKAIK
jgi:hypothetical protein